MFRKKKVVTSAKFKDKSNYNVIKKLKDKVNKSKSKSNSISRLQDKNIDQRIIEFFDHIYKYEYKQHKKKEFRVSSFPYCPILFLDDLINQDNNKESYDMEFYSTSGTAIHELVQKYAGLVHPDLVLGNWICSSCNHLHTDITTKPKRCKKCRSKDLKYEEITFSYKPKENYVALSGHLDMLSYIDSNSDLILAHEFKTCGNKYIVDEKYEKYLPFKKHPHQILTYCCILYYQYDILVDGYVITYLTRDKPKDPDSPKSDSLKFSITREELEQYHDEILMKNFKAHYYLTKSLSNRKYVDRMLKYKSCKSASDYKVNGMDDAFFGSESCYYYKSGLCFKPDEIRTEVIEKLKKIK